MEDIYPTGKNATILIKEIEPKSAGGVILVNTNTPKIIGSVIRVGKDVEEFTVGDTVLFTYNNGKETTIKDLIILPEESVLAVIR